MTQKYRPDIDGLRAISVLIVILFHFNAGFPGGFVGVDVFFVISGYLITTLIASDLDSGSFSLADFWSRRIRRIWPASLAMTIATLAAGWLFLLPHDLRALGGNAIAHLCMAMNIRLWLFMDYFAPAADLQPLLHTWSLALEEQFYLLFPLLLMVIWPRGPRIRFVILVAIAATSFAAAQLMLPTSRRSVFYLLPFRSWELLVGSLLAMAPKAVPRGPLLARVLASAGLSMILGPALLYTNTTPFPAAAASLPCFGAAFVIAAGSGSQQFVTKALSQPLLVSLGRMSYSLYLWHWPVLAFLRYRDGVDLSAQRLFAAALLTAFLSWISYVVIETPLRRGSPERSRRIVAAMCGLSLITLIVCQSLRRGNGFPQRLPADIRGFATSETFRPELFKPQVLGAQAANDKDFEKAITPAHCCFMLVGDSHGMVIQPFINEEARRLGISGFAILEAGVFPIPVSSGEIPATQPQGASVRTLFTSLTEHRPKNLILCGRWSLYLGDDADHTASSLSRDTRATQIRELCRICKDIKCTIWLLTEVPFQPKTPHRRAMQAWLDNNAIEYRGVSRDEHADHQTPVRQFMADFDTEVLHIVDLAEPFFDDSGHALVGVDGCSWYCDENHVSQAAVRNVLAPHLKQMLAEIALECE